MNCPLCQTAVSAFFAVSRPPACVFRHCEACDLVFKDPSARLGFADEKARYETHRNGDEGHLRFLQPVVDLLSRFLPPPARGLDWGSGPVPALAGLLEGQGYEVLCHDPFFGPFEKPPGPFDFITCTEAIEHFFEPGKELRALRERTRPGGWLAIQTEIHPGGLRPDFFESWYYARDPTHVSFFSETTFREELPRQGWELKAREGRVWLFERRAD